MYTLCQPTHGAPDTSSSHSSCSNPVTVVLVQNDLELQEAKYTRTTFNHKFFFISVVKINKIASQYIFHNQNLCVIKSSIYRYVII